MMTMRHRPKSSPSDAANPPKFGPSDFHDDLRAADHIRTNAVRMFRRHEWEHDRIDTSDSGRRVGPKPRRSPTAENVFLTAVLKQRRILAQMPCDDVARQSHHALYRSRGAYASGSSATRTIKRLA